MFRVVDLLGGIVSAVLLSEKSVFETTMLVMTRVSQPVLETTRLLLVLCDNIKVSKAMESDDNPILGVPLIARV